MFGGPGLIVGGIVGAILPKWKFVVGLIVLGAVITLFAFNYFAAQDGDENHPLGALSALMTVTNFAGWTVGLTLGALFRSAMRSQGRGAPPPPSLESDREAARFLIALVLVGVAILVSSRSF